MSDLLDKGIQNNRVRREELIKEGKTVDEANEITYKEFLETKEGKRYTELLSSSEKPSEKQSNKKEIKSSKDVSVGDVLTDINGKKGTVTGIEANEITMKMESGGNFSANPKFVELFKEGKTTETKASDEPKTNGTTDTNEQTSENNSNELPKSEPPAKKFSDTNSGEKGERMLAQRLRTNEKLDKVNEKIGKDALLYDKQKSLDLLAEYVDDIVKDYEKNGLLVDLAKEMAEGKSPFDDAIATYAATSVYDKLNNLAEKELDIQVKDELESLAAKALASARDIVTKSAKILGNNRLISKYLPISKAGIKAVVQAQIDLIQDQNISKKEKAELLNVTEQLSSIMETEEFKKLLEEKLTEKINQIAEDGAGKEVMAKFDASLDDLITPLEEC